MRIVRQWIRGMALVGMAFLAIGCGNKSSDVATENVVQEAWPYATAMENIHRHWYAGAIEAATEVMAQTGATVEGLTIRGVAHAKLNHPAEAFADLTEATRMEYSTTTLMNLGNAMRTLGYCARAIDAYQHALALDAENPQIMINLTSSYLCLNDVEMANEMFVKAIPNFPKDAVSYTNAAVLKYLEGNPQDSLQASRMAISYDASYRQAYKIMSRAMKDMGDTLGAKEAMTTYRSLKGATMRQTRFDSRANRSKSGAGEN